MRGGDKRAGAEDLGVVHRSTRDVELAQQVQQRLGGIHLALQAVKQLRIRLARGKGGGHQAHERNRVRGNLNDLHVARRKGCLRCVLQVDGLAGHADPVVLIVQHRTGAVDLAAVDGGEERRVQRAGLDASDFRIELTEERVDGGGVARALDVERAGELALAFEALHQREDLFARTTDGGHAGAGVHGRFDGTRKGVNLLGGELDDGHGALLIVGKRGLALPHEARAVAGDAHSLLGLNAARSVGRADFAHGHADHTRRAHAEGGQQVRQRDLDGGDGYLRGFGVVGLLVIMNQLQDGPAGFALDYDVELLQAREELRREGNHVLGHLAVLGAETGVHEHRTVHRRGIRRGDADGDGSLGHLTQALDSFFA